MSRAALIIAITTFFTGCVSLGGECGHITIWPIFSSVKHGCEPDAILINHVRARGEDETKSNNSK